MKYKTIYVLCPNELVTGGTEALHQMVDAINNQGGDGRIVYVSQSGIGVKRRPPFKFKHYNIKVADQIHDAEENALVAPEIYPECLVNFQKIDKYFWWLSFDYFDNRNVTSLNDVKHICQSQYAAERIQELGFSLTQIVSDYITVFPLNQNKKKENTIILPTQKIDSRYNDLLLHIKGNYEVIEIRGMSKLTLAKNLIRSKLYIDFGLHPGKDRMPREAIFFKNTVFTSLNGSCGNDIDVPILKTFKIDNTSTVDEIDRKINQVFSQKEFDDSFKSNVDLIREERVIFFNEIADLFQFKRTTEIRSLYTFRYYYYMYVEHLRSTIGWNHKLHTIKVLLIKLFKS